MTELHPLTSREHEGDHSNEETLIELQENVHQEVPYNTVDHDQIDAMPETPGEEDYDEDYLMGRTFTEIFKIHFTKFTFGNLLNEKTGILIA